MKIGTTSENTLITSVESTNKFKIQATGKAFSILSNALYQYKVKAVVREIGCNAFDAHIDAGTTSTPFTVSLPTKDDPHFKVRDFGVGLAKDKFVEVYTTYFGSSKSDSNDHTGGLGLGSKTPFIMSKTFTVHSFYNGVEYMWHSYVNDNGEPDVVMLTERETTEKNGLLVIVPIGQGLSETEQNALFREFQSEAKEIYQWFDVTPIVTVGGKPVEIKHRLATTGRYDKLKLTGVDDISVYYDKELNKGQQSENILVKMGNVVYPYNLKKVANLDRFGGAVGVAESVIAYLTSQGRLNPQNHPIVLEVGMGDVDIAPSRESLSLVNTTELTIINSLVRFTNMFFDKLQTEIDNAKTTYEKYQALYSVPAIRGRKFTIGGKEIDARDQQPNWVFADVAGLGSRTNFLRSFDTAKYVMKYRRSHTRGIIPLNSSFEMTMYGPGKLERNVILVDQPYKGELRLWVNANTQPDSSVVVVFGQDVGVQRPLTDAEMAPFLEDGHPQVVKFSELKNKPAVQTRAGSAQSFKVTDDSMLIMGSLSSSNFFTQGNAQQKTLGDIVPFDPVKNEIKEVYIAYKRRSGDIWAELAEEKKDPKDPKVVSEQKVSVWSRATGSYSNSYTAHMCSGIHDMFVGFLPYAMQVKLNTNSGSVNRGQFRYNNKTHTVSIRHVVMNAEGYDAVVNNPDYPQVLTLDQAIEALILPMIPTDVETYHVTARELSKHAKGLTRLSQSFGLDGFIDWVQDIYTKTETDQGRIIEALDRSYIYTRRGYKDQHLTKTKVIRHEYDFSMAAFWRAVVAARNANVPGASVLHSILDTPTLRHSMHKLSNMFDSYYAQDINASWINLLEQLLRRDNYDKLSGVLSKFLIDEFEKAHKRS